MAYAKISGKNKILGDKNGMVQKTFGHFVDNGDDPYRIQVG